MKITFNNQPENIRIEQVYTLFKQSAFLFLGLLAAILIVAEHFWNRVDPTLLRSWVAASLILFGFRIWMIKSFWQIRPHNEAIKWGYIFMATSVVSALLWGCIPLFILNLKDVMGVLLVSTIMTGMVAGSLVPLSCFMPTHPLFSTLSLGPFIYVTLLDSNPVMIKFGIILLIYLIVMIAFSYLINKNITESILLRFENLDLLDGLRKQKQFADQANIDKSRFLAATSHDLRQPLHALDLYLGALEHTLNTNDQAVLLEKSRRSSCALGELLNALMDISRLDAGDIEVNLIPFDLLPVLQALVEEFQPHEEKKNRVISLQKISFFVNSDPILLARIMRNLLSNAIKHNDKGDINIKLDDLGDAIKVSVIDHGKGIPENQMDKIFSEFYQLENPERDRNKGLGLGLATVQRVANLLKHKIEVTSELGKGSCFSIIVPKSDYISQKL